MSERIRGPRGVCDRFAPTLAMLDGASVDLAEWRAAQAHLAECADCQADQRAYARLDDDLRRAFSPASASPLRAADLLAAIGASGGAAGAGRKPAVVAPDWAARPTHDAIRSVVYLGDFDDMEGFDSMSDDGTRDEPDQSDQRESVRRESVSSAPARRLAAIPSLRPGPDERLGWQRWTVGFSATAAAVIVAVIAVTLFGSHGRPSASRTAAAATQTASAQAHAGATASGPLIAVSMASATDGWAIGNASWQQGGDSQTAVAAFYHYDGAQWRLVQHVKGFDAFGGPNQISLRMLSPTDGWAFDGAQALHYDGTTWRAVTITPKGNERVTRLMALDMVSPSEGWAAAYLNGGAAGPGAIGFLRYDGQRWTVEQSDIAVMQGLNMSTLTINGISSGVVGDAWAVGSTFRQVPDGQSTSQQVGLIFHRLNGVWRVSEQLNQPDAAVEMIPQDIVMLSPTYGWIVGETIQFGKIMDGSPTEITHALLLAYDFHMYGPRWVTPPSPVASPSDGEHLQQIIARAPDDIWVNGGSSTAQVNSAGVQISTLLLHYDGKRWTQVTPDAPISGVNMAGIAAIGLAPDGSLWAVGSAMKIISGPAGKQAIESPLIWLYRNGVWSAATITSGK